MSRSALLVTHTGRRQSTEHARTVAGPILRSIAISLFDRPSATKAATSRSRRVSGSPDPVWTPAREASSTVPNPAIAPRRTTRWSRGSDASTEGRSTGRVTPGIGPRQPWALHR